MNIHILPKQNTWCSKNISTIFFTVTCIVVKKKKKKTKSLCGSHFGRPCSIPICSSSYPCLPSIYLPLLSISLFYIFISPNYLSSWGAHILWVQELAIPRYPSWDCSLFLLVLRQSLFLFLSCRHFLGQLLYFWSPTGSLVFFFHNRKAWGNYLLLSPSPQDINYGTTNLSNGPQFRAPLKWGEVAKNPPAAYNSWNPQFEEEDEDGNVERSKYVPIRENTQRYKWNEKIRY